MQSKERIYYFDIIKGIAIFMVVMGHVLCLCMSASAQSTPMRLIANVHMPLFFFISGWFTYKLNAAGRLSLPSLKKRFVQLIIPMAVVSSLYILVYNNLGVYPKEDTSILWLWSSASKKGYWFNIALFEVFVLFAATIPLLNRSKNLIIELLVVGVIFAILIAVHKVMPTNVSEFLTFYATATYYPIFAFGCLAHRHKDKFFRLTENPLVATCVLISMAVPMYYLCWPDKFALQSGIINIIFRPFVQVCVAFMSIVIFRPIYSRQPTATNPHGLSTRILLYLGNKSLGIYLLHYFFLFPMPSVERFLVAMNCNFVPTTIVSFIIAAAIVATTVLVIEIIKPSKLLTKILTGG